MGSAHHEKRRNRCQSSSGFAVNASTLHEQCSLFDARCICICAFDVSSLIFFLLFLFSFIIHSLIDFISFSSSSSCSPRLSATCLLACRFIAPRRIPINCEKSHMVSPLAHFMQSPSSRAYILYHLKIGMQTLGRSLFHVSRVACPIAVDSRRSHFITRVCLWRALSRARMALYWKANLIIIRKFFFHLFLLLVFLLLLLHHLLQAG